MNTTGRDGHGWRIPPLPVIIALGWIVITGLALSIARVMWP